MILFNTYQPTIILEASICVSCSAIFDVISNNLPSVSTINNHFTKKAGSAPFDKQLSFYHWYRSKLNSAGAELGPACLIHFWLDWFFLLWGPLLGSIKASDQRNLPCFEPWGPSWKIFKEKIIWYENIKCLDIMSKHFLFPKLD